SEDVRGPFKPIPTNVDGIQISELLPRMAKQTDRLAIVRSVHHTHGGHNSGMYWSIVGKPYPVDSTLINPTRNDYPSLGTLAGWLQCRSAALHHHAGATLRQHGLHHAWAVRRHAGRAARPTSVERQPKREELQGSQPGDGAGHHRGADAPAGGIVACR